MLNEQNAARTRAGVPPLAWDATLADHARAYARELARTGRFEHADQPQGPGREGENLWTGTRDAYGYGEKVAHWVDEGLEERRVGKGCVVTGKTRWSPAQ